MGAGSTKARTGGRLRALGAATAVAAVVTGLSASPAEASPRTLVVTLVNGTTVTVTVDVPPGTPVDQIKIPGIALPIVNVQDVTPPPSATPGVGVELTPTATPTPAPTQPGATPTATPGAPAGGAGGQAKPGKGGRDRGGKGGDLSVAPSVGGDADAVEDQVGGLVDRVVRPDEPAPAPSTPGYSLATPGAAPIGVPNFFIDKFRIPPFLLPIYQAAGIQYGVRWEVLAAINEIETDYGRNLNVSTAGAEGWMQFMPATWKLYGTDANRDGTKDPYNPVDAIFASARYLKAAGADTDIRKAIFAYNHADWYVDSVMLRARLLGGLPSNFVGSLTGLTQGRFPVAARATYADAVTKRSVKRAKRNTNAAVPVESDSRRTSIDIFSKAGKPVVAVADGRVTELGRSADLGRYVKLQDVYGNTYQYSELGSIARRYPAAKPQRVSQADIERELELPAADAAPTDAASAGRAAPAPKRAASTKAAPAKQAARAAKRAAAKVTPAPTPADVGKAATTKERLFANPLRPEAERNGGGDQVLAGKGARGAIERFRGTVARVFGADTDRRDVTIKRLTPGSRVVAGTVLGSVGATSGEKASHMTFRIRPAGKKAPLIDPKPILDGWKLLETTEIYRAQGRNPFSGPDARAASIGQILLMSKDALIKQVLADPRVEIYEDGRRDIALGQIDRRVLATIEFLSLSGLRPTITSLRGNHGLLTSSGNVSEHSSGNAVDIGAINGIRITPQTQGPGSITDIAVRRLLTLQGTMKPHQVITLMDYPDVENAFAMSDHDDHIHVGFHPLFGDDPQSKRQLDATLAPKQWIKLVDRLNDIDNPVVAKQP